MRELTSHKVSGLNEMLIVGAVDEPDANNSCHHYRIRPNALVATPGVSDEQRDSQFSQACCDILFQNGPIAEVGVNGISNEALLTIVEDRLSRFQRSEFACRENAVALTCIQTAMLWLHQRSRERTDRGVEGTLNP